MKNPVRSRAQQALAERGAALASEERRLLDAGIRVIERAGTARVADVVADAGLSNDAFYRHFASKEAFIAALIEDGAARLRSYLEHQMAKEATPEGQVRRWVEGVLDQAADDTIAATTRSVLSNGAAAEGVARAGTAELLVPLLVGPFAALGSAAPELDALLVAHAVVGRMSEHLFRQTRPSRTEIEGIVAFALRSSS